MNQEQFKEWRLSPTTVEIFEDIGKLKVALSDSLAGGDTVGESVDTTALVTARIVGTIQGINQLLEYNYEDEEE